MQVKNTEYNFRNDAIRWQISKSTNVIFYTFDIHYGTTCANESDKHTDRQTHLETEKPIAIG